MTIQPSSPEFALSTQVARVKVPQYLFPPGIRVPDMTASVQPLFPLVVDYNEVKPEVIGQPEFVNRHAEISRKYLEANYPDYASLPENDRKQVAHDYSYHFVIELLVYQALAKGAEESAATFSFTNTLEDIADELTFPNFLNERLSDTLKKTHPMYANVNRSDLENSVSVRPIVDDEGKDSLLISINNPEAMQNDIRNGKIGDLMREKLKSFDVAKLLDIYLHDDQQHDFVKKYAFINLIKRNYCF